VQRGSAKQRVPASAHLVRLKYGVCQEISIVSVEGSDPMMPLVFVVDGVQERRSVLQHILEQAQFQVAVFATARVLEAAAQTKPALMIIATELPDGSGLMLRNLIRHRPELTNTPVVLLTDNKIDEQTGRANTHDYILSFPLLSERVLEVVNSALREHESSRHAFPESIKILIDPSAMKVFINGKEIATTTLEFRLIDYMARHQGKVFTRDALLDAVWGDLQFVTPRSVDACIRRIRRKTERDSLATQFLRTVRGVGYKLDATPKWESGTEMCNCRICSAARARTKLPSASPVKVMSRSAFLN
jgi:DNA-binding response OmpR family regulator